MPEDFISKHEIEEELEKKGEFLQIDYLTNLSKANIPITMKKFVYSKLAQLYEKKYMFKDSAKMYNNIALISIAFTEKIKYRMKEAKLYIKSGNFEDVEVAMKKAMSDANASEKAEIYFMIKDAYKRQAEIYEKEMKRNHASQIYERLLHMNLSELEKDEIKKKLLVLYEKLGKLKEYFVLKKSLE